MTRFPSELFEAFFDWYAGYRMRRDIARTNKYLQSLPGDLRKDIGWPDGRRIHPVRPASPERRERSQLRHAPAVS